MLLEDINEFKLHKCVITNEEIYLEPEILCTTARHKNPVAGI